MMLLLLQIFDMSKFESSVATELRNTVIDKRRLLHLCMITFSFVRNVFDDLDTPCWVCLINYAAMATLGTNESESNSPMLCQTVPMMV